MADSISGDAHRAASDDFGNEPADITVASSVTVQPSARAKIKRTANTLQWGEALWIRKQRPVQGTMVAFHDADSADDTLLACFMVPSLPQLSTDFIDLASMMDPGQPFFALYLPSEKRTAETGSTVHQLAQYYADEIHKRQPNGPLVIGGWSAGATVALVVAELLLRRGHEVPLLVIIDGAPLSVDTGRSGPVEKARLGWHRLANVTISLVHLGRDLVRRICNRSPQNPSLRDSIRLAWRNSAFRLIWERTTGLLARTAGQIVKTPAPQRHPAEIASNIAGVPPAHQAFAKALYDAVCAYKPEAEYAGNVLVFESTLEPARSSEKVAKRWARIAPAAEIVPVEGSHMSIVRQPNGRPLARILCQRLRDVSMKKLEKVV
jgi:thioesterase domain-containing protein